MLVNRSRALWECGKAEPSLRGFSKPLWESAIKKMREATLGGFPQRWHFHRPAPFFFFLVTFSFSLTNRFPLVENRPGRVTNSCPYWIND